MTGSCYIAQATIKCAIPSASPLNAEIVGVNQYISYAKYFIYLSLVVLDYPLIDTKVVSHFHFYEEPLTDLYIIILTFLLNPATELLSQSHVLFWKDKAFSINV